MKFFGEKSVSSVMYNLLSIYFGVSIFVLIILALESVIDFKVIKMSGINYIESGMFKFELENGVRSVGTMILAPFGLLYLIMTKIAINLFDNFRENIIFDKENVKFIRNIAYLKILVAIVMDFQEYFHYKIAVENIVVQGLTINYKIFGNSRESLFTVITLFMIAIALEEAIKYKEENELTV